MMVACKLLGLPYVWHHVAQTNEVSVWPRADNGDTDGRLDGRIKTSQTYGAMMNLIEGKADIILRSTTASDAEKAAVRAAGVTLVETPIALDAFVFLKHPANSVESLTLEQIRKIYTKQITDWSQVGGDKAAMKVFTRPRNSGSEEALRELVMGDLEPAEFPEEQQFHEMWGMVWEMGKEKYGIGYIFKNYKEMIMRRPDQYEPVFSIDGVQPTPATMKNRTYPLTTEVYAIIRSDLDQNSMGYKLYEWLQSESAKAVLEECGFTTLD
jgi:phosphate transport system substrate-binding protein